LPRLLPAALPDDGRGGRGVRRAQVRPRRAVPPGHAGRVERVVGDPGLGRALLGGVQGVRDAGVRLHARDVGQVPRHRAERVGDERAPGAAPRSRVLRPLLPTGRRARHAPAPLRGLARGLIRGQAPIGAWSKRSRVGTVEGTAIARVEVYGYELTYVGEEYVMSGGRSIGSLHSTVVRVVTEAGVEGFGETCPLGSTYLAAHAEGARAALRELAPAVVGADPAEFLALGDRMDAVLTGHEYAKSA